MSKLTTDDVRHIAKLARLQISDDEVEKYSTELSAIMEYINMLSEVDTENVEPLATPVPMVNQFREDTVYPEPFEGGDLLETSPLPIIDNQIQTPSAHG